jgi:hypothetical protein
VRGVVVAKLRALLRGQGASTGEKAEADARPERRSISRLRRCMAKISALSAVDMEKFSVSFSSLVAFVEYRTFETLLIA